jgi:hypothetical protein
MRAFDRAFSRGDSEATLVIKTQNADFHAGSRDAPEELSGRKDIVWINQTLARQDV